MSLILQDKETIANLISSFKIGVIPTDTIYGIVGLAKSKKSVNKIFKVKGRSSHKPLIVLISKIQDLEDFEINLSRKEEKLLKTGEYSIILPCPLKKYEHIHRGFNTIAFRLPKNKKIKEIINLSGPIVATSANKEGEPPIKSIEEGIKIFKNEVDFYLKGKTKSNRPSKLIKIENGKIKRLR